MSCKSLFNFTFAVAFALAASVGVLAQQTAPVNGTVELVQADGTRVPVAGAVVEVYQTDNGGRLPSGKTNSKGQFTFAGIQIGSIYILSASGPGCTPNYITGIRAGQEKVLISLTPGDGSKLTEDEVRNGVSSAKGTGSAPTPESEAEMKKAQAEYEAKKKEIEARNKKAEDTNKIVSAALKAGNEAFSAKNYDVAIAKYDEGIGADPNFVGSAPILNNNRSTALMSRGVDTYNNSVKLTDISEKIAGMTEAKKDLADSAEGFLRSWNILKDASAAEITDRANYDATKAAALKGARDTFNMAVRTEQVDTATIEAAKILIPAYLASESDSAKKAQASLIFADLYRVIGDSENAIAAYMKILESQPDNQDALAGAGLSLVNLGYINSDKTKLQEGSNLLQKFVSLAPNDHKYKADATALIDTLKKEQNVTPQKVTNTKKKP